MDDLKSIVIQNLKQEGTAYSVEANRFLTASQC